MAARGHKALGLCIAHGFIMFFPVAKAFLALFPFSLPSFNSSDVEFCSSPSQLQLQCFVQQQDGKQGSSPSFWEKTEAWRYPTSFVGIILFSEASASLQER